MDFIDRKEEMMRLNKVHASKAGGLIVIWGRRRIGKTRLLLEWTKKQQGLYWVADESSAAIQRRYFARALDEYFPGFSKAEYTDWGQFFDRLTTETKHANWKGPLVIDELPYLIAASKELPSILQRWIDHDVKQTKITVILSGSSQSMMQGCVLNYNAPLYGRATELFKLNPLPVGYIEKGLAIKSHRKIIEAYTLWGGVPRYWELASSYKNNIEKSASDLVLHPSGPLHQEPHRLLLEEMPSAISLRPILDVIGSGVHRLSEIAARLNQPATSLSHPLIRLQELGLVKREIPFGESEKSGKTALYKINDPFFRFWFNVVAPRRGLLADTNQPYRLSLIKKMLPNLISQTWEELCLSYVSKAKKLANITQWMPAKRFWKGNGPEWDIVSECIDQKYLLLGEAKWPITKVTEKYIEKILTELQSKGIPQINSKGKKIIKYCIFVPEIPKNIRNFNENVFLIDANSILNDLK